MLHDSPSVEMVELDSVAVDEVTKSSLTSSYEKDILSSSRTKQGIPTLPD